MRQGDPICDRYGVRIYENRGIFVIADGCNWGERPKLAAQYATNSVLDYLSSNMSSINCVQDAQVHLLRSFVEAQNAICKKPEKGVSVVSFFFKDFNHHR